jgi:hypothetical protein
MDRTSGRFGVGFLRHEEDKKNPIKILDTFILMGAMAALPGPVGTTPSPDLPVAPHWLLTPARKLAEFEQRVLKMIGDDFDEFFGNPMSLTVR